MTNESKIFTSESLLTGRTQIDTTLGYNTNDFSVDANNILNLKNKTSYWSCVGADFHGVYPDTDNIALSEGDDGTLIASADGISCIAGVNLPHGAVVTGIIIYGNAAATAETWNLFRTQLSDSTTTNMATANIGTEDTSISNATIDNLTYGYFIQTTSIDTNDVIYGARITYTTDYI